ncbi:ERCC4 domain-domain-containing protein [Coniella lustricola]|uniref:Crossover junction endonuclease MUS81 n=1 Tax=Coniella lustricola TaxID=2025994 RepID=A0A2T3A2J7_9PEZI|nr:ERCC4 domain-domain-containing protein [Coniella lustricola]
MPVADDECANPLYLSWVKEWLDKAREHSSMGVTTYRHAYNSLKACPIPFEHPSQLQQLRGFGPKLCDRLTTKLQEHCSENGLPMPAHPTSSRKRKAGADDSNDHSPTGPSGARPKKPKAPKRYVPNYRTGAYALVVALSEMDPNAPVGMAKQDLCEAAQPYSDSSFTAPSEPGKFYTAWDSMKTLVQKEIVYERGRPTKRYALTDEGWELARQIQETRAANGDAVQTTRASFDKTSAEATGSTLRPQALNLTGLDSGFEADVPEIASRYGNVVSNGPANPGDTALPKFSPVILQPGMFTVHLVLDVREVRAKTDRDYMQEELTKRGVRPIMRSLELGDVQWVAKCNDKDYLSQAGAEGEEVVLDYIIERKRLDDLIGSIKDGRFNEQKFRLRRSGVKHVTYLIEEISLDQQYYQKYEEAVQSAIASTQVVHGFTVKRTQKMDDSIRYLARMTELLKKKYESKPLKVIPTSVLTAHNYLPLLSHLREIEPGSDYYVTYPAFASLVSKSDVLTLRDLYLKMLMCIRGLTGEKALQIQRVWKTPNEFVEAFLRCGTGEQGKKKRQELVFNRLGNKVKSQQVGKALSIKIAEVWGDACAI